MAMNASEQARIAGRKEAVKAGTAKGLSPYEARKRYYVRTRVAELEKAGKPVSAEKRKQLREKFNSGDVSRRGFAAPKKKVSSSSSSSSPVISGTPTGPSSRMPNRNQIEGRGSYKSGPSSSSSSSTSSKKGRSGGGKVYDFARNELLGVDDFGRVGKNLRKGNYGKAAKSAAAGAFELGTTALSVFGIGAGIKGATTAAKAAKVAKGAKAVKGAKSASNMKYYKNLAKGKQAKNYGKIVPTTKKVVPLTKAQKAANLKYYKNLGKPAAKVKKTSNLSYYKNLGKPATKTAAKSGVKSGAKSGAKSAAKSSAKTGAKSTAKTIPKTTKAQKASNMKYYKNLGKSSSKTPFMQRPNGKVMNTYLKTAPTQLRLGSNYTYNEEKRKRSRLLG